MAREAKQVIVIRTDLNMRKGKMVAQGAHAAMVAYSYCASTDAAHAWQGSGVTKICVGIDSEEGLLRVRDAAQAAGLPVAIITDAGRTEFHGVGTRTCLAIGPCWSDEVDPITGELRLL